MRYRLLRDDDRSGVVVSEDLKSEFAATTWARAWLESHADHDRYRLEPEDDTRPILMIRTVAGQWYAIPVAADAGQLEQRKNRLEMGQDTAPPSS